MYLVQMVLSFGRKKKKVIFVNRVKESQDVRTTWGDNKIFEDFDHNFDDDDEMNEKIQKWKEKEFWKKGKGKGRISAIFHRKCDSSYDETIKKLQSTNFGIFIYSDFIQQMVPNVKPWFY